MAKVDPTSKKGAQFSYLSENEHPKMNSTQHCHDRYEILFVVSGEGKYTVEGTEYPIHSRTLMVIPPLHYHSVSINPDVPYERYVVFFNASDLTEDAKVFLDEFKNDAGTFYAADEISSATVSVFERLKEFNALSEEERRIYEKLLISELVFFLSLAKRENVPSDEGELGARVIKYINEHIDKNVSLDFLAKKFFVSKYYLCRAFKKHNGISVHGYINQKRVIYAKQLIESGETASAAAYRVGFGDYSAFYRAYVKIVGTSPSVKGAERSEA